MPFWRRRWFLPLLLTILILIVYAPVGRFHFIDWDDWLLLAENPDFSPVHWSRIATYWIHGEFELYAPLSYTAWAAIAWCEQAINHQVPLSPGPFHLANLTLHLLAAQMTLLLLYRLTQQRLAAFAGAMVFALHPLQIEPVAWVASFNTVLSIALTITALWAYVCHAQVNGKSVAIPLARSMGVSPVFYAKSMGETPMLRWWFIVSCIALLLALSAKAMAISAPAIALLLEVMILRRPWRKWAAPILIWIALTIPYVVAGRLVQMPFQATQTSIWLRPLIVLDSFAFYLEKLFWPVHQTIAYGRTPLHILQSGQIWFTWIVSVAAVLLAYIFWKRRRARTSEPPWLLAGLAIMFVATFPTSGIVGFAFQRYSTVADRYMYLGMIGVAIAVAGWAKSVRARFLVPGIAVVAVLFICRDMVRVRDWRDTLSITANAAQVSDYCALDHRIRAFALARLDRNDEAITQYQLAIHYDRTDPETYYNYANLLYRLGNKQAMDLYHQAIAIDPHRAQFHHNYAVALMSAGQTAQAGVEFRTAAELDPTSEQARNDYAKWLQWKKMNERGAAHRR